ncbi:MAG: phosphatidylserine decarboxylase [Rhodobacteraceae bacterium]|nr:phosphatidylserine decarboxylase [Paracoccaceae bacterium]
MTMLETFIKPMHREGLPFVTAFAVATLVLFWIWEPVGWAGVGMTLWCYYFFRDPKRAVPTNAGLMVSPADGVVSLIERAVPPAELGMAPEALVRVSVFMSVFNCHVNRAPIAGKVAEISYRPGKFLNAAMDKASIDNERNSLRIDMVDGRSIAVVQIAGLVARRIVCFASKGQDLRTGERFGLIRFGSRLDIYLPDGVEPQVAVGQNCVAGETVIAVIGQDAPQRIARME